MTTVFALTAFEGFRLLNRWKQFRDERGSIEISCLKESVGKIESLRVDAVKQMSQMAVLR